MIIHGILSVHGSIFAGLINNTFDNFIHEMYETTDNNIKREPKKLNWEKTKVFDNSNRGRMMIYQERWK